MLEESSAWLEGLCMSEDPATGGNGMQECVCPLPCPGFAPGSAVPHSGVK